MGDPRSDDLRVGFDNRMKLTFRGSKATSVGGRLACREFARSVGTQLELTSISDESLTASRLGEI